MSNSPQSTDDLQAVINALVGQLKQQGKPTKVPPKNTWVQKHFAAPKSLEAVIWRACWLFVVPAIAARLWLPVADWCFSNGYPLVTLIGSLSAAIAWYLLYLFAINSEGAKGIEKLVEMQFTIPSAVVFFVLAWEILKNGR